MSFINFDAFDEHIGVDGYYRMIIEKLSKNSNGSKFYSVSIEHKKRFYPKGSVFSRVRNLNEEKTAQFYSGKITIDDFYPPKPSLIKTPEGRFNRAMQSTMYLADHPFVAMMECEVNVGDFFLLSYFSLPKDMIFFHLEEGKCELSSLLYNLFKAKDKRFYPVTNLIYEELSKHNAYDGIVYDSTKIDIGYIDVNGWGEIKSNVNIAIQGIDVKNFTFEVSWLLKHTENSKPEQWSIYTRLSNKKNNKLSKLNYRDNKNKFIAESNRVNETLHHNKRIRKIALDKINIIIN